MKRPKGISRIFTKSIGILNFNLLPQLWREPQKIGIIYQKPTVLGLWGCAIGLESRISPTAHLHSLLSLYNNFQIPSSIWRGNRRRESCFQVQKEGKFPIPSFPNSPQRLILDTRRSFDSSLIIMERNNFCEFCTSASPPQNLGIIEF